MKKLALAVSIIGMFFFISCFYDTLNPQKDYSDFQIGEEESSFLVNFESFCLGHDGVKINTIPDESGNYNFPNWLDPSFGDSLTCDISPASVYSAVYGTQGAGNVIANTTISEFPVKAASISVGVTCNPNNSVTTNEDKIIIGIGTGDGNTSGDYGIKGILSCYYDTNNYARVSIVSGGTEYTYNVSDTYDPTKVYDLSLNISYISNNEYDILVSLADPNSNAVIVTATYSISLSSINIKDSFGFGIYPDSNNYGTYAIYYVGINIIH